MPGHVLRKNSQTSTMKWRSLILKLHVFQSEFTLAFIEPLNFAYKIPRGISVEDKHWIIHVLQYLNHGAPSLNLRRFEECPLWGIISGNNSFMSAEMVFRFILLSRCDCKYPGDKRVSWKCIGRQYQLIIIMDAMSGFSVSLLRIITPTMSV